VRAEGPKLKARRVESGGGVLGHGHLDREPFPCQLGDLEALYAP